jgi:hypothetical protein
MLDAKYSVQRRGKPQKHAEETPANAALREKINTK